MEEDDSDAELDTQALSRIGREILIEAKLETDHHASHASPASVRQAGLLTCIYNVDETKVWHSTSVAEHSSKSVSHSRTIGVGREGRFATSQTSTVPDSVKPCPLKRTTSLPVKPSTGQGGRRQIHRVQRFLRKATMDGHTGDYALRRELEPNDTQVMPSQVLHDYMNSLIKSNDLTTGDVLPEGTNATVDNEPGTYQTGERGHIDLVGFGEAHIEHEAEEGGDHVAVSDDELGEVTQTRLGVVTSPPGFLSPTTPGLAGHKRDSMGNILNMSTRTPAQDLSAMFKNGATRPVMGLSQVFHQTQAPSSPPIGMTRSDPIFERPSPDFRQSHHSSPGPESSPVMARKNLQRAITDPRDVYVSMRDSQEFRRKREEDIQRQLDGIEDHDELSPDTEERKADLRRQKAAIAAETNKLFATIDAPTTSKRKERSRKLSDFAANELKTPATRSGAAGRAILISDDTPRPLPSGADDVSEDESDTESRDEYDELSQAVINIPRSSPIRMSRSSSRPPRPSSSPRRATELRDLRHPRLVQTFHPGTYSSYSSSRENQTPSQTIQVAYSQPGTVDLNDSLLPRPPRPVLVSSENSRTFISQPQQDFSISSSTRAHTRDPLSQISSSIPPAPALPADDLEDRQRAPMHSLPSSPPIAQSSQMINAEKSIVGEIAHTDNKANNENLTVDSASRDGTSQLLPKQVPAIQRARRKPVRSIPDTSPISSTGSAKKAGQKGAVYVSRSGPKSGRQQTRPSQSSHSNSTAAFGTALTHLTDSANQATRSQSECSHPSPKKHKIKKLKDVRLDSSQKGGGLENDIYILNDDDYEFTSVLNGSSPHEQSRKRVKHAHDRSRVLQEPSVEENRLPPPARSTPKKRREVNNESPPLETSRGATSHKSGTGNDLPPLPAQLRTSDVVLPSLEQTMLPKASRKRPNSTVEPRPSRRASRKEPSAELNVDPECKIVADRENPRDDDVSNPVQHPPKSVTLVLDTNVLAVKRFPNRFLARFKDTKLSFWPATCLGRSKIGDTFRVRFDDGNVDESYPGASLIAFELRAGDPVRLDVEGHQNKTYIVCEAKNPLPLSSTSKTPETDIIGNTTVAVRLKQKKNVADDLGADAATFDVQIGKIYLTSNLVGHYRDRAKIHPSSTDYIRLETPTTLLSAPTTPSSRTRRRAVCSAAEQAATSNPLEFASKDGLFSNMAFAVSYTDNAERASVMRSIRSRGGHILPDGFDALFSLPETMITKVETPPSSTPAVATLTLTSTAAGLGFVAYITDKHSRREKYMQALALDIPCLSGRWVHDSINKGTILPWDRYLLPAGESSALHGAVRSRTLSNPSYNASTNSLKRTVADRPKLLEGKNVILVVDKGQAEERRRAYVFLTFALGAARVERVKDITAARMALSEPDAPWDWVYVDGDVEATASELAGRQGGGKKRKRQSEGGVDTGQKRLSANVELGERRVRVVGDEFVVQTLILGALVEED